MRWWRRKRREHELERELRSHLDLEAEEQMGMGQTSEEARFAARRAFGNVSLVKEEVRAMWSGIWFDTTIQNVRYALRALRKSPAFSVVAILSLALGIGADSAIFSLIDGLWTRPMAVPKPSEIVRLFSTTSQDAEDAFTYPEYLALKENASDLQGLVARGGRGVQLPNSDGTAELHTVNVVSDNFFSVLGIQPALGRLFTPEEKTLLSQEPVAVLGNSFWKSRYGGDAAIAGKHIELQRGRDRVLFTVLGVLPETFRDIDNGEDRDIWLPAQSWVRVGSRSELEDRGFRWFRVLGRLTPGLTVSAANAQVEVITRRLASEWPASNRGRGARVVSDASYRLGLAGAKGVVLLVSVLLLVLLSSVNVANLLLARGARRSREIAVRLSLGAARSQIVFQLMMENFVLGCVALLAGLSLGAVLIQWLPALLVQPPALSPQLNFYLDSRVLCFSLLVSLATIFLFGLAPAFSASGTDLTIALRERAATAHGTGRRLQARHWLSISQIGLSLVLLTGTGLTLQSFVNTRTLDYGITRKPLLDVWVFASGSQAPALYREALDSIRQVPSVKDIAFASRAPLSLSEGGMSQFVTFPDQTELAAEPIEIKYNSVSSNYFAVMGTRLVGGRIFNQTDQTNGLPVVVISQTMARRFWGFGNPIKKPRTTDSPDGGLQTGGCSALSGPRPTACAAIGKLVHLKTAGDQDYRVIGIVQDVPINEIGEPAEPYLYLPYGRHATDSMTFIIQTDGYPLSLAQPIRHNLISLSHELDPFMMTTQQQLVDYSSGPYQTTAELVSTLGAMGLLLTAIGLYGVISYGVTQRTREIGIRMALGADQRMLLRLVCREVGLLGVVGMAVGLPLALLAARSASALLFGVSPWNVFVFSGAVGLLTLVLFAAGAIPAYRASRVDPMIALRFE